MTVRLYRAGYSVTDVPGDLVTLCGNDTVANANYQTFLQIGTAYQVPVGKTLYLTGLLLMPTVANAGIGQIGYGDTAVSNSVAAPTSNFRITQQFLQATANDMKQWLIMAAIPAQKYPYYVATGGANVEITVFGVVI